MTDFATLSQYFSYDPDTGVVRWRVNQGSHGRVGALAGSIAHNGYVVLCLNWRKYFAHRVGFLLTHGRWPEHPIDHINGVKTDNRLVNLRECPISVNSKNKAKTARNSSGAVGVFQVKDRWYARIKIDGAQRSLGSFTTFDAAVAARRSAEARNGFHPNHGRPLPAKATNTPRKPNPCGIPGVTRRGQRWAAQIKQNNRYRWLGTFDTPEEAGAAVAAARMPLPAPPNVKVAP